MKKRLFGYVAVAAIAMSSLVFTSCGDDGNDSTIQTENAGGNNTGKTDGSKGTSEFIEPCLDWGCDADHIKQYMPNSWILADTSDDNLGLIYDLEDESAGMVYLLNNKGRLYMVAVYYINQPETKLTSFVEEVEKRYNCTMTKMESEDSVYIAAYTAETTINGRTAYVMVCYDQHKSIEIYYGLC